MVRRGALLAVVAMFLVPDGRGERMLMVPAAMSASCAFMLPVATAPNSVVFGSGLVTTVNMAREGLMLKCIAADVITGVCYLVIAP